MTTVEIFTGTFQNTETKRLYTGLQVTDLRTGEKSPVYEVTRFEEEFNTSRTGTDKVNLAVIDRGNGPFDARDVETLIGIRSKTGWKYGGKIVAGSAAPEALNLALEKGIRVYLHSETEIPQIRH